MPETLITRRCSICKIEKSLNEFGTGRKECLGKRYQCKPCMVEKYMEYYRKNRDKILAKNKTTERRMKKLIWGRAYADSGRRKRNEYTRSRDYIRPREKILAKRAVWNATKSGKLMRPLCCSKCGKNGKVEAHHHKGYEVHNRLNVEWLCHKCHMLNHRKPLEYYLKAIADSSQKVSNVED